MDLVIAVIDDNNIGVLLGYDNGSFVNQTAHSIRCYPTYIILRDLNNDTFLGIIVANYGTGNVFIFVGSGNGTFADSKEFSIGYGTQSFSVIQEIGFCGGQLWYRQFRN